MPLFTLPCLVHAACTMYRGGDKVASQLVRTLCEAEGWKLSPDVGELDARAMPVNVPVSAKTGTDAQKLVSQRLRDRGKHCIESPLNDRQRHTR